MNNNELITNLIIPIAKIIKWLLLILIIIVIAKLISKKIKMVKKSNYHKTIDQIIKQTKSWITAPKDKFEPDYKTYTTFLYNPYNIENVNNFCKDILKYCNYKGIYPTVKYKKFKNNIISETNINNNNISIAINLKTKKTHEEILGIVIHECMKILIYDLRILYPKGTIERAADVVAIHMGLYKYMVQGYENIGYTNIDEFNYIFRKL